MNIKDISPAQLRQYIQSHHENEYALIDVRQPDEYKLGHIPGANLLPLPKLIQSMETLPGHKQLVFYCHSGGRSMAAASIVADEGLGTGDLINLDGGMLAWDGGVTADYPDIQLFDLQAATSDLLRTAMNLEKGALNFYTHVGNQYRDHSWVSVFENLAKAELGHARTVYHFWRQLETGGADFETLFANLPGEVLEGGMTLGQALEAIAAIKGRVCLHLIEMALKIEYAAFDLYHAMADRATTPDAQEAFVTIAQAEKAHMQALAGSISKCHPPGKN